MLFPPDTEFVVVPQYLKPASPHCIEHIIALEVYLGNRPIFILQLTRPADLQVLSYRERADEHIRARMGDLAESCPIPTLHAVSAMGTRLSFYRLDIGVTPMMIVPPNSYPNADVAPAGRWDCDVLDGDGEAKLRAVVKAIKEACVNIADV